MFLTIGPVAAQPLDEPEQSYERRGNEPERSWGQDRSSNSTANLPDWAKPSTPSAPSEGGGQTKPPSQGPGGMQSKAAPPPPPRDQVPVDGGLALLAAAGVGYAVRKLGKGDKEGDDLP